MHIYEYEINDDLKEKIENDNSIAFDCEIIDLDPTLNIDEEHIKKSLAFVGVDAEKQKDLFYLNSVLVSAGWNKNDDVFDVQQLWDARNTPVNKQFNYMHDDTDIIGHMTASIVMDQDGSVIKEEGLLPEKIDIVTSAVIYKTWSDPQMRERVQELCDGIDAGEWSVSMECIFSDFDYAILGPDDENRVLARTEESSFLTKHLRAYGGDGEYQGYKIGRLLKGFYFSGKGLVAKPANPRSVILSKDTNPFDASASVNFENFLTATENHEMSDNTKQIEDLTAEFEAAKSEIKENFESQIAELTSANESLAGEKADLEAKTADLEAQAKEHQCECDKKDQELKAMKEKYSEMEKAMKDMKRSAMLKEKGKAAEEIDSILVDFAEASDEMFESVVALMADKHKPEPAPEPAPEPEPAPKAEEKEEEVVEEEAEEADASELDEVEEVAEATLANPEEEVENTAIASAAQWLRKSVLKSTKNLK